MVDLRPFLLARKERPESEGPRSAETEKTFAGIEIPDEPITLPFLDKFEGTARWEAANFRGPGSHAVDFNIGFDLHDGHLRIDPISANGAHGGYLTGRFDFEPVEQGFAVRSFLQFDGGRLELSKIEKDPGLWPSIEFDVNLESHGRSLRELMNHANGHLGVILGEGVVASTLMDFLGSDILVELFAALNPFATKQGETNLECAVVRLNLADGIVTLKPFAIRTESMTTVGGGSLDLVTDELEFDWVTKPRQGLGLSASTLTNPYIKVGGTLSKPSIAVKPLEATIQTGAAVATMGLSLVAQGLWDRMTSERKVCEKAIEEAEAGLNEE